MHFLKKLAAVSLSLIMLSAQAIEIDKTASMKDTTTTMMGINHIGISVANLDEMLKFYQDATGYEVIRRETVKGSSDADKLYGHKGVEYEMAILKAPNMLLELIAFKHNKNAKTSTMPVIGPGMTHTCFQSPESNSGFKKFQKAGADVLSREDKPVDLGGYGVTYAYAYDPEGNMMELEQLDGKILARSGYDSTWKALEHDLWMSQVALVTHDLEALMSYYQGVLGFKPYRVADLKNRVEVDNLIDMDNATLIGGWFKMNQKSKVIEFWQYTSPKTPKNTVVRQPATLGYSYSIEVADIQKEYKRMKALGVDFISEPQLLGEFWQVFARDPDSNIYSLRQVANPKSTYSITSFDPN
ncbi:VOC family protein [uncultured Paraglaciecola sp.]|uniref:VOC family protein n=1 Tax=uncultured Paraglaciecola sp. TaxID=1765024 RepID=UPI00260E2CA3|nr:VOC family protein [uncultured Paraglaciecola sp.]